MSYNRFMSQSFRTISVHCARCRTLLYRYRKGGRGGLVKCLLYRITKDYTAGDMICPQCGQTFAREQMYGAHKGHKIIQGKIYTKGMPRK